MTARPGWAYLAKRTTLLAMAETMHNDNNGGWRPGGTAGLKPTFSTPADSNGRSINGVQSSIMHRF